MSWRSRSAGANVSRGRLHLGGEYNLAQLPLPKLAIYLEPGDVTLGLLVQDLYGDPVLAASVSLAISPILTQALHRVFPYEEERVLIPEDER